MNEDAKLNDFLKERLEADVPGEPPRLEAILHAASVAAQARAVARRRSVCLWGGLLAAASLAVISIFGHLRRIRLQRPRTRRRPSRRLSTQSTCSARLTATSWT